jgi:hypothetical protein
VGGYLSFEFYVVGGGGGGVAPPPPRGLLGTSCLNASRLYMNSLSQIFQTPFSRVMSSVMSSVVGTSSHVKS